MARPSPKRRLSLKIRRTFADVRREAEARLARGLRLDFDRIMLDIAAIRRADKKLS
jgi:hypothetical protein